MTRSELKVVQLTVVECFENQIVERYNSIISLPVLAVPYKARKKPQRYNQNCWQNDDYKKVKISLFLQFQSLEPRTDEQVFVDKFLNKFTYAFVRRTSFP